MKTAVEAREPDDPYERYRREYQAVMARLRGVLEAARSLRSRR